MYVYIYVCVCVCVCVCVSVYIYIYTHLSQFISYVCVFVRIPEKGLKFGFCFSHLKSSL